MTELLASRDPYLAAWLDCLNIPPLTVRALPPRPDRNGRVKSQVCWEYEATPECRHAFDMFLSRDPGALVCVSEYRQAVDRAFATMKTARLEARGNESSSDEYTYR